MQMMGYALYSGRPAASPSRTEGWTIDQPVGCEKPAAASTQPEGACERQDDETCVAEVSVQCTSRGDTDDSSGSRGDTPSREQPRSNLTSGDLHRLVREEHRSPGPSQHDDLYRGVREETRGTQPMNHTHSTPCGQEDSARGVLLSLDQGEVAMAAADSGKSRDDELGNDHHACGRGNGLAPGSDGVARGDDHRQPDDGADDGGLCVGPNVPAEASGRLVQFYASYHPALLRARDAMDGAVGHV